MSRDERVKKIYRSMGQAGILIAVLVVVVSLLQEHFARTQDTRDFLYGMTVGMRTAFPILLFLLAHRVYQAMDEYGRIRMLKAAALAFVVVMGFSMMYYPLQDAGKLPLLPMWVLWALGFATFGVSVGVQSRT